MRLLEVSEVCVNFGGLAALTHVSFGIQEGEIVALIGPNGAGKTTMFNCITGFQTPTSGIIRYRGKNITGLAPHQVARLGIVRTFQKTMVFPGISVEEGVLIGTHRVTNLRFLGALVGSAAFREEERAHRAAVARILEFVGLSRRRCELGKNLSYGEQRLLEVAVALASEPDLLLLDEPAAGLNPEEAGRLTELIRKIRASGITVLLVEHNMSVVMNISDHVVVLNEGRKIAEGEPAEIRSNPEVIKAYLGGVADAQG